MVQEVENFENFNNVRKRMEIMIAGRLRRKGKIKNAIAVQDKLSKKSGSWEGEKEIRKWREKR